MPSAGRIPSWPIPWLDLATAAGGSRALREALGYASKTTLSAKIAGRSPWTKADYFLLKTICRKRRIAFPGELLSQEVVDHFDASRNGLGAPIRSAAPGISE